MDIQSTPCQAGTVRNRTPRVELSRRPKPKPKLSHRPIPPFSCFLNGEQRNYCLFALSMLNISCYTCLLLICSPHTRRLKAPSAAGMKIYSLSSPLAWLRKLKPAFINYELKCLLSWIFSRASLLLLRRRRRIKQSVVIKAHSLHSVLITGRRKTRKKHSFFKKKITNRHVCHACPALISETVIQTDYYPMDLLFGFVFKRVDFSVPFASSLKGGIHGVDEINSLPNVIN